MSGFPETFCTHLYLVVTLIKGVGVAYSVMGRLFARRVPVKVEGSEFLAKTSSQGPKYSSTQLLLPPGSEKRAHSCRYRRASGLRHTRDQSSRRGADIR